GVPVEQEGKVVGAIGIRGLAEQDDEALAMEVLNAR
ncbi:heme-binding protein, partial [Vibrio parahaemolyticus]